EKMTILIGYSPEYKVEANADNTLSIQNRDYVETGPGFFQRRKSHAAFRKNAAGEVTNLFFDAEAFERIKWYDTNNFQLTFAGISLGLFLYGMLLAIIRFAVGSLRQKTQMKSAYLITAVLCISYFGFLALLWFTLGQRSLFEFTYPVPTYIKI